MIKNQTKIVFNRKEIPAEATQVRKYSEDDATIIRTGSRSGDLRTWKLCVEGDETSARGILFVVPDEAAKYLHAIYKRRGVVSTYTPAASSTEEHAIVNQMKLMHQSLLSIETMMQELLTRPITENAEEEAI